MLVPVPVPGLALSRKLHTMSSPLSDPLAVLIVRFFFTDEEMKLLPDMLNGKRPHSPSPHFNTSNGYGRLQIRIISLCVGLDLMKADAPSTSPWFC
jgi:hypothetical protein